MLIPGIFTRTYNTKDIRSTFRRMTGDGILHCNLNFANAGLTPLPERIPDGTIREILDAAAELNITMDSLTGTFNMIDPDEGERERGIRQFRLQCEAAAALKIPVVSLCTGSKNPDSKWAWDDRNAGEEARNDLLRTTERILRFAEDTGTVLGVETEVTNVINTAEAARWYLDSFRSDRLKIIMDGANLLTEDNIGRMDEVFEEAFDLLGNDIVLAHAKDFKEQAVGELTAAGEGVVHWSVYFALLKKHGFDGPVHMHNLPEERVRFALDHLGEYWN